MERYNTEERELDLMDMFWKLLKSWRLLAVWALVGALLLGAFGYVSGREKKIERDSLIQELTRDEIRQLNEAEDMNRQVRSMERDMDADPVMQLNPYEISQTTLQFYIGADSVVNEEGYVIRTYNEDLQAAYEARMSDDDVRQGLANLTGTVSADMISSYVTVEAVGTSSVKISIVSGSTQLCEQMADYAAQILEKYRDTLRDQIGEHTLTLVAQNTQSGYNSEIDKLRSSRTDSLNSLKTKLTTKENALSDVQKKIYNYDVKQEKIAAGEDVEEGGGLSVKYVILGFVLGGILACVWVAARYVLDGKVKTADDMLTAMGGGYAAVVVRPRKKRFLGAIDGWLTRLQHHGEEPNEERGLQLAVSSVELLCKRLEQNTVYITGTGVKSAEDAFVQKLAAQLSRNGLTVQTGVSVTEDAASLEQMVHCGCVLFVEEAGRTRYHAFEELVALCRMQGTVILGAVVLA